MTREEVGAKVQKLFELSKSPNENEAALAAAKARELLSRYNLSMADLPTDSLRGTLQVTESLVDAGRVLRTWVKGLFIHVAVGFGCTHLIRRRDGLSPVLSFIGTEADAQVASATFQFLFEELNHLADKALPALKRQNRAWGTASLRYAYLEGAVKRVGERFREEAKAFEDAERETCTALVLAKEQMIGDFMARTFPHLRTEYARSRMVSANAFDRGYTDGNRVALKTCCGEIEDVAS